MFCLDFSGSMSGRGISELRDAMDYVLGERATKDYIQFTSGDKIDIVPFSSFVDSTWSIVHNGNNAGSLLTQINNYDVYGTTALFPAAVKALDLVKNEDMDKYNVSIILMTDGQGNVGTYYDLYNAYNNTNKNIPIYSISFGSADEYELNNIATLTNAKVFDGKTNLVEAFKSVRGYN